MRPTDKDGKSYGSGTTVRGGLSQAPDVYHDPDRLVEGEAMYQWAFDLFPVCRSITGPGVRETLAYLGRLLPDMQVHAVPTGTQVLDWIVPDEWTVRDAFVADEDGRRVIDFRAHNLHLMGYSEPVDKWMTLDELQAHLYSRPDRPHAIPYVTSYYKRRWGFCLAHADRENLKPGRYHVVVDADLKPGVLNYGEVVIPGETADEVLLSTYICHPSMANNELSGPVVLTGLGRWLASLPRRKYTYRLVFVPETIGALTFLSRSLPGLKSRVIAGYNLTCVGDDRTYSYLPSRHGETLSDRAARHVLHHIEPNFARFTWWDRGSDESHYCAPGVDLPMACIMRTKHTEYPEYHTSDDDLNVISPAGLQGGLDAVRQAIEVIEFNDRFVTTVLGEPQLGRRGLYPTISQIGVTTPRTMMHILSMCDGEHDLLSIADMIDVPFPDCRAVVETLLEAGLLVRILDRGPD